MQPMEFSSGGNGEIHQRTCGRKAAIIGCVCAVPLVLAGLLVYFYQAPSEIKEHMTPQNNPGNDDLENALDQELTAEASLKSCDDLKWSQHMIDSNSDLGACMCSSLGGLSFENKPMSFEDAHAACDSFGARLCDATEIEVAYDVVKLGPKPCGVERDSAEGYLIWTNSQGNCARGMAVVVLVKQAGVKSVGRCEWRKSKLAGVRCCADTDPEAARDAIAAVAQQASEYEDNLDYSSDDKNSTYYGDYQSEEYEDSNQTKATAAPVPDNASNSPTAATGGKSRSPTAATGGKTASPTAATGGKTASPSPANHASLRR